MAFDRLGEIVVHHTRTGPAEAPLLPEDGGAAECIATVERQGMVEDVQDAHAPFASIRPEQIAAVNSFPHVADFVGDAVGDNDIRFPLELGEIVDDPGIEELRIL